MPTIPLASGLGLNLDGSLAPGAKIETLFPVFTQFAPLTLATVPRSTFSLGLDFSKSVDIGQDLSIAPGTTLQIELLKDNGRPLDADDPFSAITIANGDAWLAMTLTASLGASFSLDTGFRPLGLAPKLAHDWKVYRRFSSSRLFGEALAETFHAFVLPLSPVDLTNLSKDVVLVFSGSGSITAKTTVSFALPVTPLAALDLPLGQSLNVTPGASIGLTPSITLEGGYQVRLRRLDDAEVELGVYQRRAHTEKLSLSAKATLSSNLGSFELGSQLISALTIGQPVVNQDEILKALPDDPSDPFAKQRRAENFEKTLRAAVNTKVEASLTASLSHTSLHEPAWTYAIKPNVLAGDVLKEALHGDYRKLLANPPGARRVSSVLTDTNITTQRLDINLIGLLNFTSVTKLVMSSELDFNDKDQLTLITDTASVSVLEALTINFGKSADRLRSLLNETFLLKAAYQASGLGMLPPTLKSKHTYFEVNADTSREDMRKNLQVLQTLGLTTSDHVNQILEGAANFGRTTFYVQAIYDNDAINDLLFAGKDPKSLRAFEDVARTSLGALIAGDELRAMSRQFTDLGPTADALWNDAKDNGLKSVFPIPANDSRQNVIRENAVTDFSKLVNWSSALAKTAKAVQAARDTLGHGPVASTDPKFDKVRRNLHHDIGAAASASKEHFGDPLGLVMIHVASGGVGKPGAILTINGKAQTFGSLAQTAAAAGAGSKD